MKKEKLLKTLKEASLKEESVIKIYSKHLDALITRAKLKEEDINVFKELITKLIDESKDHKNACNVMIDYINKENKNDY